MFVLIFSAICAWFAFLLPCFATFKALQQRPLPEADLVLLCKYWTVIGGLVAIEYCAEWLVSWIPFYWQVKTIFLLFLSLPQTQGSTFVYDTYLRPFFVANEKNIDAGILSVQGSVIQFIQSRIAAISELLWSIIQKQPPPGQVPPAAPAAGQQAPASGINFQSALNLWQTYGPALASALQQGKGGAARAAPASASPASAPVQAAATPSPVVSNVAAEPAKIETPASEVPATPEQPVAA